MLKTNYKKVRCRLLLFSYSIENIDRHLLSYYLFGYILVLVVAIILNNFANLMIHVLYI